MAARAHARRPPSAASRWLHCAGSVNFIDELDEDGEGGMVAAHGTILHSFCEDALRDGRPSYDYVGETREHEGFTLELTDELADMMQAGLDYIDDLPGKLYIEHQVRLDKWMPGDFGTLDVGIIGKRRITIFDWKWGFLPVSAVENEQLMIYALGFWYYIARHLTDVEDFRLIIWQPRAPGGGGEWDVSLAQLLKFAERLKIAAEATVDPDAPRTPGTKQCMYCPGAKMRQCPEYDAFNLALVIQDFDELDERMELGVGPRLPRSVQLTPERRSYILEHRPMFEKWFERLHADALDDALRGDRTPGLKAVYGRNPARKWKGEDPENSPVGISLKKALGEEAFTRKLLSPAQAEKALPGKLFAKLGEHIDKGQPKPTLVSEHDARPAIAPLHDLFDDLDD